MRVLGSVLLALSFSAVVGADDIYLVGGGKVSGEIVERSPQRIVVDMGLGRVTLPMTRVTKVVASRSALQEFRERAQHLAADDAAGWVALGRWAQERDLATQARDAYRRALALDPGNALANAGVGRVEVDGRWLSQEEANQARGLVPFEGSWVTPAEREAARRERSEADLSERAEREALARAREAEARARVAEAEARRAETEATPEPSTEGIPYWPYGYGYGGGGAYLPHPQPGCCRPDQGPHPRPVSPARTPPTGSLNGSPVTGQAQPVTAPPAPGKKR